jgi:putative endonuclease
VPKTKKQETGDIGEKIAGCFLVAKGFEIVGKNYRKPWGEIDIIVRKKGKIHFIEVKTVNIGGYYANVTCETSAYKGLPLRRSGEKRSDREMGDLGKRFLPLFKNFFIFVLNKLSQPEKAYSIREISDEEGRSEADGYRPEDNLHPWKLKRLKKAILSYLSEKRMSEEDDWQFDAVTVRIDEGRKSADVEYLEDIIL